MSAIQPLSRPAILVVEDEPLLRMDAADLIGDAGFAVYEAASADEALAILQDTADICVVFTDIDMPGSMNGIGLAHTIRRRWPHIEILMTSGHRRTCDIDFPCEGRFLSKPYPAGVVTKALSDVIHRG